KSPRSAARPVSRPWAHGLRPPRRTDTSLAASCPGLFASRGLWPVSGPPSPSAPTHATLPPAPIVRSCDTLPSHHPARPCLRFLPEVVLGGFDDPLHDVAPQSVQFLTKPFLKVVVADLSRDDIYDDLHELQVSLT